MEKQLQSYETQRQEKDHKGILKTLLGMLNSTLHMSQILVSCVQYKFISSTHLNTHKQEFSGDEQSLANGTGTELHFFTTVRFRSQWHHLLA